MADEILVVDDEDDIRTLIADILEDEGYSCRTASNSDGALSAVSERRPDLLILDIWLEGSTLDGMDILERVYTDYADIPVVMISGHGNIETAVNAIKFGAYDFIEAVQGRPAAVDGETRPGNVDTAKGERTAPETHRRCD